MSEYVLSFRPIKMEADSPEEALERAREMLANAQGEALPTSEIADALMYYADPEAYWAVAVWVDPPAGQFGYDLGCVLLDGEHDHRHGRMARRALGNEWWGAEPCEEFLQSESNRTFQEYQDAEG